VIPDQSSGNAPKLQLRLIARKFRLKLGFLIVVPRVSPVACWLGVFLSRDANSASWAQRDQIAVGDRATFIRSREPQ